MYRLIAISALALGLAACDDAPKATDTAVNEADVVAESAAVEPSSTVESTQESPAAAVVEPPKVLIAYSAAEMKDGYSLGELSMGAKDAPVTMIEYASLTCSHCAQFHTTTLPALKEKYINTGKVRLVFRNFVFNQYDLAAATLARCTAPEQSFEMMSALFASQSQWMQGEPLAGLADIARKSGMNRVKFDACLRNEDIKRSLMDMRKQAMDDGVTSTPSFFINGKAHTNGPLEDFIKALDDAL